MIFRAAVQRHRQNSGDGRFAYAAVAAEYVSVRNPLLLNGILQSASDVVLPNHIGELLRTVFSGKDLIAHRDNLIINGGRMFSFASGDLAGYRNRTRANIAGLKRNSCVVFFVLTSAKSDDLLLPAGKAKLESRPAEGLTRPAALRLAFTMSISRSF